MKIFILILLGVSILVCDQQSPKPNMVSLNEDFELRLGQRARVAQEHLEITLRSVVEDSRCPTGANCVWEGNAGLIVEIKKEGSPPVTLTVNTNVEPKRANYLGYELLLKKLEPYPKSGSKIRDEDYQATLALKAR